MLSKEPSIFLFILPFLIPNTAIIFLSGATDNTKAELKLPLATGNGYFRRAVEVLMNRTEPGCLLDQRYLMIHKHGSLCAPFVC